MTETPQALKTLLDAAPKGANTYALMDCALDSTICPTLHASGCAMKCLYTQSWQTPLGDVAPYLVELDPKANFSTTLLTWDWYANWGYFVQSAASLDDCAQAFMAVTTAQLPNHVEAFFRFQDPRVLRVFFETASADDVKAVFGKATRLVVPMADDGVSREGAIVYTLESGKLHQVATRFDG